MNRIRILASTGIVLATAGGVLIALASLERSTHAVANVVPLPHVHLDVRVNVHGKATVRSVPAGIACPQKCAASFPPGTSIILKTHEARGWHLLGWSGTCGAAANCRLEVTAPVTLDVSVARGTAPLSESLQRYIRARPGRISVAVYDFLTGTTYLYAPRRRFDAASTVKVQILGTALYKAQRAHRWLTTYEQSQAVPMIERSDNDAATALWDDDGWAPAVQDFDDRVPMPATTVNIAWGLTQVTAGDDVSLLRRFRAPNALLDNRSRAYALGLMEHVTASQHWGVSAGVPAGVTVALKNGWLLQPYTDWTVESIGWINGDGRDYAIAVLTDRNESERAGIATIEGVSKRVFASLSVGAAASRAHT